MKVQPPAEAFQQELSRPSLGIRVKSMCSAIGRICAHVCVCVCVTRYAWGVCFHTHVAGKTSPLLMFHSAAFVVGQSHEFFNIALASFVLTCHDDPADKRKHVQVECLIVCSRTCHSPKTERNPTYVFTDPFHMKKWPKEGVRIELTKDM